MGLKTCFSLRKGELKDDMSKIVHRKAREDKWREGDTVFISLSPLAGRPQGILRQTNARHPKTLKETRPLMLGAS